MRRLPVRWKLTFLYAGTVAAILAVFIGADIVELRRDFTRRVQTGTILPADMQGLMHEAIREHILMAFGLTAAVLVVGYFFIKRALRPVRELADTARKITAEDLSLRVDAGGDKDEIGELARTLNGMIERLEQSFEQVKRFSGDAAHELNTPLTVLKGELEIALRKDRTQDEYRGLMQRLLEEVRRLSEIVDNLLFLSLSNDKTLPPAMEPVALDRTLMDAYEEVLPSAAAKGVGLEIERLDEIRVRGDASLLRRMAVNLIVNAVKFTPAGGRVTISMTAAADGPIFTVSDTGIGIPKEHIPNIFERFYRVDKSRSSLTGGSGLGLAIVKDIADRHGLRIDVASEPGRGTQVAVVWPAGDYSASFQ